MANGTSAATITVEAIRHVNINCSQLELAQQFYEQVVGLQTEAHTGPDPQDGSALGMGKTMQWDAFMLNDHLSFAGTALDLLEWKSPSFVGSPHSVPNALGFSRLAFKVANVSERCETFADNGVACFSAPEDVLIDRDADLRRRFFMGSGPDGMPLEFYEDSRLDAGVVEMGFVNINCSDIQRSMDWYAGHFGFEVLEPLLDHEMDGLVYGASGRLHFKSCVMRLPHAPQTLAIQLCEWSQPQGVEPAYSRMNNLGLYRMALAVDDCAACYEQLKAAGVNCPSLPQWMDMGPDIPVEGVWALFFFDPDGACLELIQNPELVT